MIKQNLYTICVSIFVGDVAGVLEMRISVRFFYISQAVDQQVEGGDSPLPLPFFFFSLEFLGFLKSTLCFTEENSIITELM